MFDFTPSEKKFIFIISGILILAGIFQLYQPFNIKKNEINYSESDSIFSRLSHIPQNKNNIDSTQSEKYFERNAKKITFKPARRDLNKGSININTASEQVLVNLPRIGPAIANRIIEYRTINGPFKTIEDLKNVRGIGKKTLEKIKPYLQQL